MRQTFFGRRILCRYSPHSCGEPYLEYSVPIRYRTLSSVPPIPTATPPVLTRTMQGISNPNPRFLSCHALPASATTRRICTRAAWYERGGSSSPSFCLSRENQAMQRIRFCFIQCTLFWMHDSSASYALIYDLALTKPTCKLGRSRPLQATTLFPSCLRSIPMLVIRKQNIIWNATSTTPEPNLMTRSDDLQGVRPFSPSQCSFEKIFPFPEE